jgi:hypothetical protein
MEKSAAPADNDTGCIHRIIIFGAIWCLFFFHLLRFEFFRGGGCRRAAPLLD